MTAAHFDHVLLAAVGLWSLSMTWIKLDDDALDHPKVASLSDRALRWWLRGLCYASRFLTDGVLPPVFWKPIPQKFRAEIVRAGLWEWEDPNFLIHDYLHHQSSRESVMQKRTDTAERVARYRTRQRNAVTPIARNAAGDALVTPTESRDQIRRSDIRDQKQRQKTQPPLIKSHEYIENRKKYCTFVGGRLEVPHGLHADLRKLLGGENADAELMSWYANVDADIEASGEAIAPDVFKWLKARYAAWRSAAMHGTSVTDQLEDWTKS